MPRDNQPQWATRLFPSLQPLYCLLLYCTLYNCVQLTCNLAYYTHSSGKMCLLFSPKQRALCLKLCCHNLPGPNNHTGTSCRQQEQSWRLSIYQRVKTGGIKVEIQRMQVTVQDGVDSPTCYYNYCTVMYVDNSSWIYVHWLFEGGLFHMLKNDLLCYSPMLPKVAYYAINCYHYSILRFIKKIQ